MGEFFVQFLQDEQRPDFSVDPLINNLTECTLDRARTKDVQPMKISLPQINNFYRRRKPVTASIDWLRTASARQDRPE
jgi:hypothetical protein